MKSTHCWNKKWNGNGTVFRICFGQHRNPFVVFFSSFSCSQSRCCCRYKKIKWIHDFLLVWARHYSRLKFFRKAYDKRISIGAFNNVGDVWALFSYANRNRNWNVRGICYFWSIDFARQFSSSARFNLLRNKRRTYFAINCKILWNIKAVPCKATSYHYWCTVCFH